MSRVPKPLFRTRAYSSRRADVKDQGYRAAVQVSGHVAQFSWDCEAEDGGRVVRVCGCGTMHQMSFGVSEVVLGMDAYS
jgi:hypothetical protein